jgi:hypothetical protein
LEGGEAVNEPIKDPVSIDGISIDLISTEKLDELGGEKIRFILDAVKQGRVLVLERGLSPSEELELIQTTMSEIDQDSFIGIETPGFTGNVTRRTFLQRVFGRAPAPRMMVVGPAALLRTIKKDGRTIQAIILTREDRSFREEPTVIEGAPEE